MRVVSISMRKANGPKKFYGMASDGIKWSQTASEELGYECSGLCLTYECYFSQNVPAPLHLLTLKPCQGELLTSEALRARS